MLEDCLAIVVKGNVRSIRRRRNPLSVLFLVGDKRNTRMKIIRRKKLRRDKKGNI